MALRSSCLLLGKTLKHTCFAPVNKTKFQPLLLYSTDKKTLADDVGKEKQVYYGILTPQIKAVKVFSISSSLVGIIGQPFLYDAVVSAGNIPVIIAVYSFIGFFTVGTPFMLHFITKKYVTHLLYKEATGSYIAKTVNFFCITKQTEFKPEEVQVPDVPGMFTTFFAKGKPLFIDPRLFDNPEHYARIMGYDKPIDFKLSEPPTGHKSS